MLVSECLPKQKTMVKLLPPFALNRKHLTYQNYLVASTRGWGWGRTFCCSSSCSGQKLKLNQTQMRWVGEQELPSWASLLLSLQAAIVPTTAFTKGWPPGPFYQHFIYLELLNCISPTRLSCPCLPRRLFFGRAPVLLTAAWSKNSSTGKISHQRGISTVTILPIATEGTAAMASSVTGILPFCVRVSAFLQGELLTLPYTKSVHWPVQASTVFSDQQRLSKFSGRPSTWSSEWEMSDTYNLLQAKRTLQYNWITTLPIVNTQEPCYQK